MEDLQSQKLDLGNGKSEKIFGDQDYNLPDYCSFNDEHFDLTPILTFGQKTIDWNNLNNLICFSLWIHGISLIGLLPLGFLQYQNDWKELLQYQNDLKEQLLSEFIRCTKDHLKIQLEIQKAISD
uniref:hypothetical protein n=1 Tax=Hydrocytium acuminatum TaxID=1745963 RepID=UPI002A823938|nr:hypothetical protein UYM18_pgp072 [Hydrocytium acuminatum]WOR09545.1 hypothetical protein [Hydrocytium acuminatum]